MLATVGRINAMLLRPFRQAVDIETAALLLVLLIVASGLHHQILERVEL